MNQILETLYRKSINRKIIFFQFILFVIILVCTIIYVLFSFFSKNLDNKKTYILKNNYDIYNLYNAYRTSFNTNTNNKFEIIGNIKISKINLDYPIISLCNSELLKLSICKFYGPYPNTSGNLCLCGHNYDNNMFFSNLNKLSNNDTITIYTTNNNADYYIYNIYETFPEDVSCLSQNTKSLCELTLITCNNLNNKRLIVKAREKL